MQDTSLLAGGQSNPTSPPPASTPKTEGPAAAPAIKPPAPTVADEEDDAAPPAKPPRPVTEGQKNEMILKEAFPSVDLGVIKAVLSASAGRVEPAFNALLGRQTIGSL